jgi:hypothetical protein
MGGEDDTPIECFGRLIEMLEEAAAEGRLVISRTASAFSRNSWAKDRELSVSARPVPTTSCSSFP